jgi:hypothetical protein
MYPFFSHLDQTGTNVPFLLISSSDRNNCTHSSHIFIRQEHLYTLFLTSSSDRNYCTLSSHILIRQEQLYPFFLHIHQTGTNIPFLLPYSSGRNKCTLSSLIFIRQEQLYHFFSHQTGTTISFCITTIFRQDLLNPFF